MYLIKNGNKIKLRVFMKKCKTCGEVLLWKFYYKDNNKIGLSARCKTCTKSKYTYICECCLKRCTLISMIYMEEEITRILNL